MSSDRKTCTIIGSDKGGVGKSMVSQLITLVFDNARHPLQVVEIDNQRKLSSVLGEDRIDLSLDAVPDLEEVSRDRFKAESFFNPVYLEWAKGDSLTDLGANVTTSLLAWFRKCEIGELAAEDGIDFRFVAVASPDEQALRAAAASVEAARDAIGAAGEYYVVLNDASFAGFAPYGQSTAWRAVQALAEGGKATLVDLPFCESQLFEYGKAMGMNPLQTVQEAERVAAAAVPPLDPVAARVAKRKMIGWLKRSQENLAPLLTVESAPAAAPAAA